MSPGQTEGYALGGRRDLGHGTLRGPLRLHWGGESSHWKEGEEGGDRKHKYKKKPYGTRERERKGLM